MIITEEAYLEHYGKKGMKWGVRRAAKKGAKSEHKMAKAGRSVAEKRQDRTAAAVGLGTAFLAARFFGGKTGSVAVAFIGGTAAGVAGARMTKSLLSKDHNKSMSQIKGKSSQGIANYKHAGSKTINRQVAKLPSAQRAREARRTGTYGKN